MKKEEMNVMTKEAVEILAPAETGATVELTALEKAVKKAVATDVKVAADKTLLFVSEDGTARLYVPRILRTVDGVNITLAAKDYKLPKTVKAAEKASFVVMVQRAVLDAISDKTGADVGKINAAVLKNGGVPTPEQDTKLDEYSKLMKLIETTKKRFSVGGVVPSAIAKLVGADVAGTVLDIELGAVRKALSNLDACYNGVLNIYGTKQAGETIEKTAEAAEYETAVRQAIKSCLAPFTDETAETVRFKLSISVSDIVRWYQLGANQWGAKVSCRWTDAKNTSLNKSIVKYLLYKIAAGNNTAEDVH